MRRSMGRLSIYLLFLWVFRCSEAFNVDTDHPLRFNGSTEDFFGYSVHQYQSENRKQIIVGAPLGKSTGTIYTCTTNLEDCRPLQPGSENSASFGFPAAVLSSGTRRLTSCNPYLEHECDGNSYLNGICYQYNSNLQPVSKVTAGFQGCKQAEVNLVFLIDGSSSMKPEEFELSKRFILNIMAKLSNSPIKFAAVQFSKHFRTVFDFNDYQNGFAIEKLMKERHMSSLTHTYGAISYALNNLLNNVSSGVNPNARKALVIITDGEPTDSDTDNVLDKSEKQNILRYIIGIGRVSLEHLRRLASEPKHNNTFYIDKYAGLQGLLDNLHKFFYNIEGSQEDHSRDRQGCKQAEVNLVFLIDGSSSMKPEEFELSKRFILNIMAKLSNSPIKFAAVQFSKHFRTVFDFNDYQNGFAIEKLMKERHMSSLTHTYGAISYALNNLLNNVSSGVNPNARKALVIITDGEPTDSDRDNVLDKSEKQNILRYIIGIGRVSLEHLRRLASEPKHNNTFYIDKYAGLQGLLDNLQKKFYNIEGSQEDHSSDRQNELSQSGFSVIYHTVDSVFVGSVGSNDWRGCLYEVTGSGFTETEIKAVSKDSYLGYSAVVGRRGGVSLLFSGAPRAEHMGLVTFFILRENTWTVQRNIPGEQIGSYFGASLCLLDVDSDGTSDFLLVGAPLYYQSQPRAEGRLYVYALSEEPFQKMLNVCEPNASRFAASLAALKDLNGDGLSDVAVGAPLEDEGTGVVYIYLGDVTHGINPNYSPQRIPARSVLPGLQQFGVSVMGQMDMSDDDLTDIVIGARGGIALLKGRPVMSVSSQLSISPKEISIHHFDCSSINLFHAFTLTSCFTVSERTSSKGSLNKNLNVTMNINLDVGREMNRAFFKLQNSESRSLQKSVVLFSNFSCSSFSIFMSHCVSDTASPLKIQMNFSQTEMLSGNATAVLDIHSRTEEFVEVPFERKL